MTTITVKVPEEMARKLSKASAQRREPKSSIIRKALDKELRSVKEEPSLYDLMKNAIGCIDSGKTDLATNPKYMKNFGKWRK